MERSFAHCYESGGCGVFTSMVTKRSGKLAVVLGWRAFLILKTPFLDGH